MVQTGKLTSTAIVDAIRKVIGNSVGTLHEPSFRGNEWSYVKECIDSTYVSSVGPFVNKFENALVEFTGARYAVAVVNGTAALHIALQLSGVREGDEVIVPALSFIATANAVTYCGAIPHFAACDSETLGINAPALREYLQKETVLEKDVLKNKKTGRAIRALVPMHTFGHPGQIDALLSLARDYNLTLVEDAAESLGSYFKGKHTGRFGLFGVLSFNGNKTITTGGGGAILTDNEELAKRAKHLTTTAKMPHAWRFQHDEIGYNYRMPNINAALGCAQMESLPTLLRLKRELYLKYENAFRDIPEVSLMQEPAGAISNYWLQTIRLAPDFIGSRDQLIGDLHKAQIMSRPAWDLIPDLKPYVKCPSMGMEETRKIQAGIINIPSSAQITG